jgi:Na+-transporting methylmalonyl-CoA/oxaloacetate decarboxylase gamma subunit
MNKYRGFVWTLLAADVVGSEQYAQLLENYNAATARAEQLEEKIRIMTAVFLLVIAVLLIIMFAILRISGRDDREEDEETREDKTKITQKLVDSETVEEIPEVVEKVSEKTEISEKTDIFPEHKISAETDILEEAETAEEPDVTEEPEKTGKFRRAVLAYLGIGDAFSTEESEEEPVSEEEPEAFFDGAWDKTEDTAADSTDTGAAEEASGEKTSSGLGFFGSKKKDSENSEDDDIEFIDL